MALASVCGIRDHTELFTNSTLLENSGINNQLQDALNLDGHFALPRGQHVNICIIAHKRSFMFDISELGL